MVADGNDMTDRSRDALQRDKQVAAAAGALAAPLCNDEGLELVYAEYRRESSGRVLRLYIDKPGGISLDDCTRVSRQLSGNGQQKVADILLPIQQWCTETGYDFRRRL